MGDAWDPGSPPNRERTRESWRQVRRLLMEWDLVGVAGSPEAADEYDCMIGPILHRLFEGADTHSLADWISHERCSHFGAGPDAPRTCCSRNRSLDGGGDDGPGRPDRLGTGSGRSGRCAALQRCRIGAMTDHAIVVADADGTITWWNPGAEVLFGHSAAAALGQSLDLIVPDDSERAIGPGSSGRWRRRG